eukprot:7841260-Alexandrium_andersonii.AAC.1
MQLGLLSLGAVGPRPPEPRLVHPALGALTDALGHTLGDIELVFGVPELVLDAVALVQLGLSSLCPVKPLPGCIARGAVLGTLIL